MIASNPFWTFSVALYQQPGVAQQCLALQDNQDIDVNLLLYACFAASCSVGLSEADFSNVAAACERWREESVKPLRAIRRKAGGEFREKLLEAELLAERHQQDVMWACRSPGGDWPDPSGAVSLLENNLAQFARVCGLESQSLKSFAVLVDGLLRRGLSPV